MLFIKHLTLFLLLLVTGCKEETVSFDVTESARKQANENSLFNAQVFRSKHPNLVEYYISARGDSSQNNTCPQGDGWATTDLIEPTTNKTLVIKCSTVSESIGCMTEEDFRSRESYSSQDGTCNNQIPFPIPKIQK